MQPLTPRLVAVVVVQLREACRSAPVGVVVAWRPACVHQPAATRWSEEPVPDEPAGELAVLAAVGEAGPETM